MFPWPNTVTYFSFLSIDIKRCMPCFSPCLPFSLPVNRCDRSVHDVDPHARGKLLTIFSTVSAGEGYHAIAQIAVIIVVRQTVRRYQSEIRESYEIAAKTNSGRNKSVKSLTFLQRPPFVSKRRKNRADNLEKILIEVSLIQVVRELILPKSKLFHERDPAIGGTHDDYLRVDDVAQHHGQSRRRQEKGERLGFLFKLPVRFYQIAIPIFYSSPRVDGDHDGQAYGQGMRTCLKIDGKRVNCLSP